MNTSFWSASAFCTLFIFTIRPVIGAIKRYLDSKISVINSELAEAVCIRKEAEEYLHKMQIEHKAAIEKCKAIIMQAEDRASRLVEKTEKQMCMLQKQKTAFVMQNIRQYEQNLFLEIKRTLFEQAFRMAWDVLYKNVPELNEKKMMHDSKYKIRAVLEKAVITGSEV